MHTVLTRKAITSRAKKTGISARFVRCTCSVIDFIMKDIKVNTSCQILMNTFAQQDQAFQFCCKRRTGLLTINLEYILRFRLQIANTQQPNTVNRLYKNKHWRTFPLREHYIISEF